MTDPHVSSWSTPKLGDTPPIKITPPEEPAAELSFEEQVLAALTANAEAIKRLEVMLAALHAPVAAVQTDGKEIQELLQAIIGMIRIRS